MEYLTLYEALRLLPVSKPTLYNLVKKGIVRRIKLPGVRKYLYSRLDLTTSPPSRLAESPPAPHIPPAPAL